MHCLSPAHIVFFQGTITLPAGFQLPPGTVLMKNEQGQIVVMQQGTLQPQHNSSTIPGTAQYKLHKVQVRFLFQKKNICMAIALQDSK